MSHVVWVFPTLTMLAALGLMACSRKEPGRYVLPATRTSALILALAALGVAVVR